MKSNIIETILGAVVLVIGLGILVFAYTSSKSTPSIGYDLEAKFDRVDGLLAGSDVRLSGLRVGSIKKMRIDPKTYMADVTISVEPKFKLPVDTVAEVASESLLGGKYLALIPGGSDKMLDPGDEITHTQAAISLESMIGQLIFSKADEDKSKTGKASEDDGVLLSPAIE